MEATRSRHGWVHMFITHQPTVTFQLYNFDLFRTCTSSFCTVAWQLTRFQLTRRIARSLGDGWASCSHVGSCVCFFTTKQKYRNFYLPQHSRRLLDMSMGRFTFLPAIFLFSLHRPFPLSSFFPLFLLTTLHFLPLFPFSRPLFFLSFHSLFSSPPPSLLFLPPQMQLGGLWERRKFPDTKTKRFCYLHIGPLLCPRPWGILE